MSIHKTKRRAASIAWIVVLACAVASCRPPAAGKQPSQAQANQPTNQSDPTDPKRGKAAKRPNFWADFEIKPVKLVTGHAVAVSRHNAYVDVHPDSASNLVGTLRAIQTSKKSGTDLIELDFFDAAGELRIGHEEYDGHQGALLAEVLRSATVARASQPLFLESKEDELTPGMAGRLLDLLASGGGRLVRKGRPVFIRVFRSRAALIGAMKKQLALAKYRSIAAHVRFSVLLAPDEATRLDQWEALIATVAASGVDMIEISRWHPDFMKHAAMVRSHGLAVGVWTFGVGESVRAVKRFGPSFDQFTSDHVSHEVKTALRKWAGAEEPANAQPKGPQLLATVAVEGRQGVACLDDGYVVSGNLFLVRIDEAGKVVVRNNRPLAKFNPRANHFGDIDVLGQVVFASAELFEGGGGKYMKVGRFHARDLAFRSSFDVDPKSGQRELCGVAVDGRNKRIWLADWLDGSALYRYNLTGTFEAKFGVQPPIRKLQGVVVDGAGLLLTADDGDEHVGKPDHVFRIADVSGTGGRAEEAFVFNHAKRAGEIEGLCVRKDGKIVVHSNRGRRVINGMPSGFYPGYTREIAELHVLSRPK